MKNPSPSNQQGSIIFYILLAIALLAALTYTINRNRGNDQNIFDTEQEKIAAQSIIEYGNTVANAVSKLRLRGCLDTEVSFENSVVAGYSNANSPSDNSCHVYHANGGNIHWHSLSDAIYDSSIALPHNFSINGDNIVTDVESGEADLILFFSGLKQNICENIQKLAHGTTTVFSGVDMEAGSTVFDGAYNAAPDTLCNGSADGQISGCCLETAGCGGDDCYHYYHVLLGR